MWILFAVGSAFFAGLTAILAKIGIKKIDSNVATAIRTIIVLIFTWLMVFVTGGKITAINIKSLIFLILSGITTGFSWIFYFKALQVGDINKVTPIDKSSIVLTMALSFILLGETLTKYKIIGIIFVIIGTYLMIEKKKIEKKILNEKEIINLKIVKVPKWLFYGILSAIFASLTSILGKIGIKGVESNYGTAIRTIIVLIMAWVIVFISKREKEIKNIELKTLIFLILSGITTGLSWLCYYRALQDGEVNVVVAIDKSSIVVSILFSYIVFKEKLLKKSFIGLVLIILGTLFISLKI